MRDRLTGIGGMNHFMLPDSGGAGEGGRYGSYAMELLINELLKRGASPYHVGRKRGDWWKWKLDPWSVDAVMIYAQSGHGRRAGLFTDFTFAVRDGNDLVPFTKAYSGLTDAEFLDLLGATNLIPGPNSTEMAIHVGWARRRWAGLAVAGVEVIEARLSYLAYASEIAAAMPAMRPMGSMAMALKLPNSRPEQKKLRNR